MNAIEFKTQIENGIIKIPKKIKIKSKNNIKVIVMYDEEKEINNNHGIINELIKKPIKIKNFKPFKREEIYE